MPLRLLRFGRATFVCVAACLGFTGLQARDHEVRVRLLNGKTGEPFPNIDVDLWLSYTPPGPRGLSNDILVGRTGADGVATFRISEPLPKELSWSVIGGERRLRSCTVHGSAEPPEEVLQHGVVDENLCDKKGKLKGKIVAKPGEWVGFAVPLRWWRLLIPFT